MDSGIFLTRDLLAVLSETPRQTLFWAMFLGLLWGVGGLTFGLTMRYLGIVVGHGRGIGSVRRVWHVDASDLQRRLCDPGPRNDLLAG